jgi:hypothetical protein
VSAKGRVSQGETLEELLLPHHLESLRTGSGLPDEVITERGYYSARTAVEVRRLGFTENQASVPALVIPQWDVYGQPGGYMLRPDRPRVNRDGKVAKYEQPKGASVILDVPPRCRVRLRDPGVPLYVTEGSKKADALVARGACAVSLCGVWNWRGTNEYGGKTVLNDWDGIALNGRLVRIAFDSDVVVKEAVALALVRLKGFLERQGAVVEIVYLPPAKDGVKQGADDFLAAGGTLAELDGLAFAELRRPDQKDTNPLPVVVVNGRFLPQVSDDCWQALVEANARKLFVFERGGELCRVVETEDGQAVIQPWTEETLPFVLERLVRFVSVDSEGRSSPGRMPRDVIADMLVAWKKPVPSLRGVVGTPLFAADGMLVTTPGYQEGTRLYYQPRGAPVPAVPSRPTTEDVARARTLLLDEWLVDFPFVDDASRANALAIPLTAVARELISGCTPLFTVDAPTPGTGKGFLVESAGRIVTGAAPAVMTEGQDEEEWRKRITAVLREGGQLTVIDNVKRPVNSAHLAGALTAPTWADRLLGKSETVRLPVRTVWMMTGNNLLLDTDMVRRSVWIRLDARTDRPGERCDFHHDPVIVWRCRGRENSSAAASARPLAG